MNLLVFNWLWYLSTLITKYKRWFEFIWNVVCAKCFVRSRGQLSSTTRSLAKNFADIRKLQAETSYFILYYYYYYDFFSPFLRLILRRLEFLTCRVWFTSLFVVSIQVEIFAPTKQWFYSRVKKHCRLLDNVCLRLAEHC